MFARDAIRNEIIWWNALTYSRGRALIVHDFLNIEESIQRSMTDVGNVADNLNAFISNLNEGINPFLMVTTQERCCICQFSSRPRFNIKMYNISGQGLASVYNNVATLDPFKRFVVRYVFSGSQPLPSTYCAQCYPQRIGYESTPTLATMTQTAQYLPSQQVQWTDSSDAPPIIVLHCDENALTQCTSFKVDDIRTIYVPKPNSNTETIAFHYTLGCVIEVSDVRDLKNGIAHYRTKAKDNDSSTKWLCYDGMIAHGAGTICDPPNNNTRGWNAIVFVYMSVCYDY